MMFGAHQTSDSGLAGRGNATVVEQEEYFRTLEVVCLRETPSGAEQCRVPRLRRDKVIKFMSGASDDLQVLLVVAQRRNKNVD